MSVWDSGPAFTPAADPSTATSTATSITEIMPGILEPTDAATDPMEVLEHDRAQMDEFNIPVAIGDMPDWTSSNNGLGHDNFCLSHIDVDGYNSSEMDIVVTVEGEEINDQIELLREQLLEADSKIAFLEVENQNLKIQVKKAEKKCADQSLHVGVVQTTGLALQPENSLLSNGLQSDIPKQTVELQGLNNKVTPLDDELTLAKQRCECLELANKSLILQKTGLETAGQELQGKYNILEEHSNNLKAWNDVLEGQVEALKKAAETSKEDRHLSTVAQTTCSTSASVLGDLTPPTGTLVAENEQLRMTITNNNKRIGEMETLVSKAKDYCAMLESQRDNLLSQVDTTGSTQDPWKSMLALHETYQRKHLETIEKLQVTNLTLTKQLQDSETKREQIEQRASFVSQQMTILNNNYPLIDEDVTMTFEDELVETEDELMTCDDDLPPSVQTLQAMIESLKHDNQELRNLVCVLETQQQETETEVGVTYNQLLAESDQYLQAAKEAQAKLGHAEDELKTLREQLQLSRAREENLVSEVQVQLSSFDAELTNSNQCKSQLQQSYSDLKAERDQLAARYRDIQSGNNKHIQQLTTRNKELGQSLEAYGAKNQTLIDENQRMNAEILKAGEDQKDWIQRNAELEECLRGLRLDLSRAMAAKTKEERLHRHTQVLLEEYKYHLRFPEREATKKFALRLRQVKKQLKERFLGRELQRCRELEDEKREQLEAGEAELKHEFNHMVTTQVNKKLAADYKHLQEQREELASKQAQAIWKMKHLTQERFDSIATPLLEQVEDRKDHYKQEGVALVYKELMRSHNQLVARGDASQNERLAIAILLAITQA